ncbi:hypothetical protein LR48_Vigan02g086900 [Vigna angularis]|uniref:Uncharacterized protein n=1 Tax=Phaseolus angularis TaxID=3914 RepID=A0A0L9TX09_PHAAN|nr:hypothetical protein LR48_Vigan02g086900 [Vigna angularis]
MKKTVDDEEDNCGKVEKTQNGESVSGSSICVSGYMRLRKAMAKRIRVAQPLFGFWEVRRGRCSADSVAEGIFGSLQLLHFASSVEVIGALMVDEGGRCNTHEWVKLSVTMATQWTKEDDGQTTRCREECRCVVNVVKENLEG